MQSTISLPSVQVLGSRIQILQTEEAVGIIDGWIEERAARCRQVVVTGYHGIWESYKDKEFHGILNSADLWVPDGIAPVFVAKLRGMRQASRVPGAELMDAFFARADFAGHSSFFYGDTQLTLDRLKERLEEKYPGHHVAGAISPPFRELTAEEDEAYIRTINESGADVLWVGLGCPRQDRWIHARLDRLKVPVAIGVGAAFRFLSGDTKRAPRWIGNCGLEWAYRLVREPKKCWRRSLVDGPKFVSLVAWEMLRGGKAGDRRL